MDKKQARKLVRDCLGPGYTRRLGAAFAVLVDGEGLFHRFHEGGNFSSAHSTVCEAFRRLRDVADLDF